MPSLLDRALNAGEAKKFKSYQKRVALINAFEAELEHDSDAELRERMDVLRERAADGESLDALLPECFAIVRETGKRRMGMRHFDVQMIGGMALHEGQISEMKTGEGKTLTATLAVVLNSLAVDPEKTDEDGKPLRRGVHVVTVNDYLARRDAEWMSPIYEALGVSVGVIENMQAYDEKQQRLRLRRRLRHELRVRLRLPARQHGQGPRRKGPARPPLRDRGRGRQHPDRRGAHAADHLRRPRTGRRPLRQVRRPGAADGARQDARGHGPAHQEAVRRRLRLRDRREAQERHDHRAGRRQGRALPRHRPPLPRRERPPRQPPAAVAARRVALQERRRLRGDRRRGQDHRRVHRAHPRRAALVGGPAPGGRGEGERPDPGGEPDPRDDHLPELLPPLRQARGHDRHRADRGDRVHEDLRAAGRADPDQHADGPRRSQRSGLQDQGGQVDGGHQRDRRAPRDRPAGARRHDLGRGLRAALRSPAPSRGSSTTC